MLIPFTLAYFGNLLYNGGLLAAIHLIDIMVMIVISYTAITFYFYLTALTLEDEIQKAMDPP
ncbi:MAG: hypothetical protein D6797_03940 [Bdellovibrio sp.]|nr:MAG: hypothetical protein D6797_03940 [Bdellovibrio sp.]